MSVIKNGLEKVKETQFIFNERGGFEVRNAYIFWTNFEGKMNRFLNATRNFNLAVPAEVGKILLERGWRVREYPSADTEELLYFVNIKINMNSKTPPILSLYSEFKGKRTKRALDINTMGELDRIDIEDSDCVVNPYESKISEGKITGYLQKLNAIQIADNEFGGKYDDWLEEEEDCIALGTCSLEHDMD